MLSTAIIKLCISVVLKYWRRCVDGDGGVVVAGHLCVLVLKVQDSIEGKEETKLLALKIEGKKRVDDNEMLLFEL